LPPVITCFSDLESRNLKDLVLIPFSLARDPLRRFAAGTVKSAAFPIADRFEKSGLIQSEHWRIGDLCSETEADAFTSFSRSGSKSPEFRTVIRCLTIAIEDGWH
jgi:hypothetical protein